MVDSCGTTTPTSRTRHWCVAAGQLPLIATLPWPWPRSGAHFKPCALRHSVLSKCIVLRYKSTTVWAHARRSGHPAEVHCAEMIMNRRPYVRSNANSRLRTRSSPARSTPARSARVAGRPHRDEPPEGEKRNPDHPDRRPATQGRHADHRPAGARPAPNQRPWPGLAGRGGRAGTINTYSHNAMDRCEASPYRATPHPIRAPASRGDNLMLEPKHNDTNRTWQHNNTARQQDDPAPRRSKLARGEVAALLLVALFVISLFLTPQITWVVGLVAGLIMLATAIALGLRLWARDRVSVKVSSNGETSARPNGGTTTRRRLTATRSGTWQSSPGDDRPN